MRDLLIFGGFFALGFALVAAFMTYRRRRR
jgi:hypothetical protein